MAHAHDDRHANNLELFLDLVFVFAVTQITGLLAADLTWAGAGRALLVAWVVWWQWSQFAWAGAAMDLERHVGRRVLVLALIPVALLMAVAIPGAYGAGGPWFGAAYFGVQLLVLAMQGSEAWGDPERRRAFIAYGAFASVAPLVVVVGAVLDPSWRAAVWTGATLLNVVGALRAASGEWAVNPVHFAERHGLIVIVALGEAVVAIGATASGLGLTAAVAVGAAVAAAGACVLWWAYFSFLPALAEHALRGAPGPRRGVLARDLFTFGHFPLIAGIVAYAVVAKHVVADAGHALPGRDRAALGLGIALVLGALLHLHARVTGKVRPIRAAAPLAVLGLAAVGGGLPGAALLALVTVLVAAVQVEVWRELRAHRPG